MCTNKISLAIFAICLILSHSFGWSGKKKHTLTAPSQTYEATPCYLRIRIKENRTAGITVSHVLYGLKTYFTYNLYHQIIQLVLSSSLSSARLWCVCVLAMLMVR